MDIVESYNIHSSAVVSLNTKFNDRCHADWSKTNLISIVTLEGIYILKPQLEMEDGPFQIELIRNPTTKFRHQSVPSIGPSFNSIWQALDHHQYMDVFLDPALNTNIDSLSLDCYPRRFRSAKWSPIIETFPRQCLLAAITIDFQLLIISRKANTWVTQCDLSSEYDRLWLQLNAVNGLKSSDNFESLRDSIYRLSFCSACWKQNSNCGPLLIAATIAGDIVVWLSNITDHGIGAIGHKFDLKMILNTNIRHINSMQLFHNLLIVSARGGQVVLYDLTETLNGIETISKQETNGNLPLRTLNLLTVSPTAILWHADNIEVTDFYIQPISPESCRIVLAKSTNICWCVITYKNKTQDEPATLAISDSFSAVDGLDPEVSLHQTAATWLRPACDKKAVLIADDGSFFQLEFIDDMQDTSPEFSAVKTGKIDLTRVVPRGLCTSPNGHLLTMISCISLMYDPAKILAPTKVLLLPIVNESKFFVDCIQKLSNESWLANEGVGSPVDVCDRIDYLLSTYPLLPYENLFRLHKTLSEAMRGVEIIKNNFQLVKMKILTYLYVKLLNHSNSRMIESKQNITTDLNEAYDKILTYNIDRTLSKALNSFIEGGDHDQAMSSNQIKSMNNYFKWLSASSDKEIIRDRHRDRLKIYETTRKTKLIIGPESCPICQAEIPFTSLRQGTCSLGHKYDRCARSLLILDSRTEDELVCEHCERHYMSNMVWPSENLWLCSYCQ